MHILNSWGIPTINAAKVAEACGNKLLTSTALAQAGVPQPQNMIAFTPEAAIEAIEEMGYPGSVETCGGVVGTIAGKNQ